MVITYPCEKAGEHTHLSCPLSQSEKGLFPQEGGAIAWILNIPPKTYTLKAEFPAWYCWEVVEPLMGGDS